MARTRRSYLPGAVFHLTARTQGREPWFTETTRDRITEYIAGSVLRTDARLLAYAIMPNHLHMVIQQGDRPLDELMQPLLRRTALLVQRSRGVEGHVFERRYRDSPCLAVEYARNAIVYTNLNPLRAGLVEDPARYTWSSHAVYVSCDVGHSCIAPVLASELALGLFAEGEGACLSDLRVAYSRYIAWLLERDRGSAAETGEEGRVLLSAPSLTGGAIHWARAFSSRAACRGPGNPHDRRGDPIGGLEQIARSVIDERAPQLSLKLLRSGTKARRVTEVRRAAILRMRAAGHPPGAIARYLRVSGSSVSRTIASARKHIIS